MDDWPNRGSPSSSSCKHRTVTPLILWSSGVFPRIWAAKYRSALEAGAAPAVAAGWMNEVEAERMAAELDLGQTATHQPHTTGEIRALVAGVRDGLDMLAAANPEAKQTVYQHMGIKLTYQPDRNVVEVESRPSACTQIGVGGGT